MFITTLTYQHTDAADVCNLLEELPTTDLIDMDVSSTEGAPETAVGAMIKSAMEEMAQTAFGHRIVEEGPIQ
jgi:hypothetical protein